MRRGAPRAEAARASSRPRAGAQSRAQAVAASAHEGAGACRPAPAFAGPRALTANRRSTLATMMETELAEAPTTATTRSGGAVRSGGTPPGSQVAQW